MAKTDAIQSCKIFRIDGFCTGLAVVVVLVKGTAVVVVAGIIFDDVVALDAAAGAGLVDVTTVAGWLKVLLEVVGLFIVPDTTAWIQLR